METFETLFKLLALKLTLKSFSTNWLLGNIYKDLWEIFQLLGNLGAIVLWYNVQIRHISSQTSENTSCAQVHFKTLCFSAAIKHLWRSSIAFTQLLNIRQEQASMLNVCRARSSSKLNLTQSPRQHSTCSCQVQLFINVMGSARCHLCSLAGLLIASHSKLLTRSSYSPLENPLRSNRVGLQTKIYKGRAWGQLPRRHNVVSVRLLRRGDQRTVELNLWA